MFQNSYHHPSHLSQVHQDSPMQLRKLFIGGLNHETTDDQLRKYFSKWGPVVDAVVIRDPVTKCSRGFGFVTFASVFSAELAMSSKPHVLSGKTVDSKRAISREQMSSTLPASFFDSDAAPGCKLTFSGILDGVHSVSSLRAYFETFGVLDQVEISGTPRDHGFVTFESKETADRCLAHNNGCHVINDQKVHVKPEVVPYETVTPGSLFESHSGTNTDCEEASEEETSVNITDNQ